jgi:hypothetical protein
VTRGRAPSEVGPASSWSRSRQSPIACNRRFGSFSRQCRRPTHG